MFRRMLKILKTLNIFIIFLRKKYEPDSAVKVLGKRKPPLLQRFFKDILAHSLKSVTNFFADEQK